MRIFGGLAAEMRQFVRVWLSRHRRQPAKPVAVCRNGDFSNTPETPDDRCGLGRRRFWCARNGFARAFIHQGASATRRIRLERGLCRRQYRRCCRRRRQLSSQHSGISVCRNFQPSVRGRAWRHAGRLQLSVWKLGRRCGSRLARHQQREAHELHPQMQWR